MTRRKTNDRMRCPRCKSRYVQSLNMPYSQAFKKNQKFERTQFIEEISPPERRSQLVTPLLAAVGTTVLGYIAIDIWAHETWLSWSTHVSQVSHPPLVVGSLLAGIAVGYSWSVIAANYNKRVFPAEFEMWSKQAVCRRCALVFVPKVDLSMNED